MNIWQTGWITSIALIAALAPSPAPASDTATFVRMDVDSQGAERALQVAVRRYRRANDAPANFVELVGVVHIGDSDYYDELNASFRKYDVVLYELVAPPDHDRELATPGGRGFVGGAQVAMKDALALSFQLDHIDYTAANFRHADLSPQELRASMDERGESLYVYFWRAMYAGMADYAKDPLGLRSLQLLSAMANPSDETALKRAFGHELVRSEAMVDALGGEQGSALIQSRNARAMEVFDAEFARGRRRIAIFYGAAHMPDFEERLAERGFEPVETRWLDAWLMTPDEG